MVCPPRERLLAYIEGLETEVERAELEKHLRNCPSCRRELAILTAMTHALRERAGPAVPDTVCTRSDELLAYADGRLDSSGAAEFERHLVHCRSCLAELADMWAMGESHECDVRQETIERVMKRLTEERRTLLVRISEKTLTTARTVAASVEELLGWSVAPHVPLAAAARSRHTAVNVLWREEGGITVEYLLEWSGGFAELTGRVEKGGRPAPAISVALSNDDGTRGPESLDAAGRFGPWRLASGHNRISLSGASVAGGLSHHEIAVDAVRD